MTTPDCNQLQDAPQLAIVAAVDSLLDNLAAVLLAVHPEILADHHSNSPVVWLADLVASEGRRMQNYLHRYRTALEQKHAAPTSRRLDPIK